MKIPFYRLFCVLNDMLFVAYRAFNDTLQTCSKTFSWKLVSNVLYSDAYPTYFVHFFAAVVKFGQKVSEMLCDQLFATNIFFDEPFLTCCNDYVTKVKKQTAGRW